MMLRLFPRSQVLFTAISTLTCLWHFMLPVTAQDIVPQDDVELERVEEAETEEFDLEELDLYEQAQTELPENFYVLYRIIERVARANDLDDHPWRVVVMNENEIGAYATQVNLILISFGLLDQMAGDSSALACVVSHEMAHHTEQHTAIFTSQLAEWKEQYQDEEGTKFEQQAVALRHRHELEADAIGYRYAATAGFEAAGCFRGFEILSRLPETLRDSSSHPAVPTRISALEAYVEENPSETLQLRGKLSLKTTDPLTYDMLDEDRWLRINSTRGGSFVEDLDRLFPE